MKHRMETINGRPIVVTMSLLGSSLLISSNKEDRNEFTSVFSLQWSTPTILGDGFCNTIGLLRERSQLSHTECKITQRGMHSDCWELSKKLNLRRPKRKKRRKASDGKEVIDGPVTELAKSSNDDFQSILSDSENYDVIERVVLTLLADDWNSRESHGDIDKGIYAI